jgi:glycosyltransferase involved in cell wall biosynthesis
VVKLRSREERRNVALFVGGFLPHKNLPRLVLAFGRTAFCGSGGRLVLVVATEAQGATLVAQLDQRQRSFVDVVHSCDQPRLELLYATSLLLVQPSLEEGFGLPAWEAMCCGLPVCVSDGGSLPEVTQGFARPFPASSVTSMAAAIDACAAQAQEFDEARSLRQADALRARGPSVREFGLQFQAIVDQCAAGAP